MEHRKKYSLKLSKLRMQLEGPERALLTVQEKISLTVVYNLLETGREKLVCG